MTRFSAVLDACVLAPMPIADTLLTTASKDLYAPLWQQEILDEVSIALSRINPKLDCQQAELRLSKMNEAFPLACVVGWEVELSNIRTVLPDPKDAHVFAVALHSRSSLIVTANISDFPTEVLAAFEVEAKSPDEFLLDLLDLDRDLVVDSVVEQHRRLTNPPVDSMVFLQTLSIDAPVFVEEIKRDFLSS